MNGRWASVPAGRFLHIYGSSAEKGPTMQLQHRGMLIHVTHIDPEWIRHKDTEGPFHLATANGANSSLTMTSTFFVA